MRDDTSHLVIVFLLTLITINLFILDMKVFSPSSAIQLSDITSVATPPIVTTNNQPTTNNTICPNSCLSVIKEATGSLRLGTSTSQEVLLQKPSEQSSSQREVYIPLGSGTTTKSQWDDLNGTETLINPANYGNIKEVYFIASLGNPTQNGQVEAQLYNVTDKHMVWGSHLVMKGPASQTLTSGKIVLDNGAKLYRVQIKSTLEFAASLDNAKIRIITQ